MNHTPEQVNEAFDIAQAAFHEFGMHITDLTYEWEPKK